MKKILLTLTLSFIMSGLSFSEDLPTFMIEVGNGYNVGVNLENAYQLDARLYYPIFRFGVVLEAGGIIQENSLFHFFIAPMYLIINTSKWRVPVAVGFDLMGGKNNIYYGIGAMAAVHYSFTKNFYAGLNLGVSYAFDNRYEEITGYKTEKITVDDGTGNAIFVDRTVPILETKSHFDSYIYFKPSVVIGLQF
jgi:hypothetical protein